MDTLKEEIVNYLLVFIKERGREVRTSDLFDEIMRKFETKLKDKCRDVVFSDEMFATSAIRETHVVYGLTYTAEDDKLIGLTEEGNNAADHTKGILGYLCDKEKERKSSKLKNTIQTYTGIISTIIAVVSFCIDYNSTNSLWLNNIVYLACGATIGLVITRMFRIVANRIGKKKEKR